MTAATLLVNFDLTDTSQEIPNKALCMNIVFQLGNVALGAPLLQENESVGLSTEEERELRAILLGKTNKQTNMAELWPIIINECASMNEDK